MNDQLTKLVTAKLAEACAIATSDIEKTRAQAKRMLTEADIKEAIVNKMLSCDKSHSHEFEPWGRFDDNFQETCKHCGWVHTS